ncbi:MAG: cellulase family glycosylhydrolase [Hallerella porci]|uniref:glycoside hydrolase family 5 protein n=1 Tax=Hallerella TaxID=2815788 RepID=UPI00258FBB5D|nr:MULTISPECIES: cellulase family glycosylhydrolase [Hallerella]MDY3922004.1 cellulase family glycosylhydrolase [Hallerella porci]
MYAILNIHWDGGWLENHVFDGEGYDGIASGKVSVNAAEIAAKQESYWKQIATKFNNDYDEHLIFASANEPGVNDPWLASGQYAFDDARMKVLRKYHEACLRAVRATGGNNATRTVVVQMPRTEIDMYNLLVAEYPTDPAGDGYTMAEAHFYPYQYSLMEKDESWGAQFFYWDGMNSTTDTKHNMGATVSSLGSKAHIDQQFDKLKTAFTSKNIPVVIGEMGAIKRLEEISGENLKLHLQGRAAWYGYTVKAAKENGIIPCIWDTGAEDNHNMTIIRRQTDKNPGNVGDVVDYEVLNAMRKAYGMDTLAGNSIDQFVKASLDSSDKMLKVTYTSKQSDSSEVGTIRIDLGGVDWSQYTAVSFQAKIDVKSTGPCTGTAEACNGYAWTSVSVFAMSGSSGTWNDYNIPESDVSSTWKTYVIPLNSTGLDIESKNKVNAIGINVYGAQLSGTLEMDNLLLHKADGSVDTLQNFNKKTPTIEGVATGILVPQTSAVQPRQIAANRAIRASLTLVNGKGQIVASKSFTTSAGTNSVMLETNYRGAGFVVMKLGSNRTTVPVRLQ